MDLEAQVDGDISALLETFPLSTSDESVAFARQAWYAGYKAGMDWMAAQAVQANLQAQSRSMRS
jgi:hypothetical protein